MELILFCIALCSLGLVFSSFMVYPVLLFVLSKLSRFEGVRAGVSNDEPLVSVIVACYNEEEHIERKVLNTLALDYPVERLEILFFSDGSTDATDRIVESYQSSGVRLVRVEGRKGKTHCQNELAAMATGDVFVFSDANTMYSSNTIRELLDSLKPEDVGVAIGRRVYQGEGKPGNQEGLYERLENWIKQRESILGGTIGANGSMYAVKAELYLPLPADRMSDIVEPLRIAVQHRKRIVFANKAIGVEEHTNDFQTEFRRKRRIVLRAMNSLWSERKMLSSRADLVFKLVFHKVIRWFTLPLLVVGSAASLGSGGGVVWFLGVAVIGYLLLAFAMLSWVWFRTEAELPRMGKGRNLLLYSIGVFLSASVAGWDFFRGRNIRIWESRS